MRAAAVISVGLATLLLSSCTQEGPPDGRPTGSPPPTAAASTAEPTPEPTAEPTPESSPAALPADPDEVRAATAMRAVEVLAGRIGPRPGQSAAYFRAARWVEARLADIGWQVRRQRFATPGGVSWGVPVEAGPSVNIVATRGDARPGRPWLLVGAHLDTVPQAPGAEDNASGIGTLLAVAEAISERRTRLPVVLVAFGSEEPRGPTDDDHHYGSRAYVASLSPSERRTLRGMVALDRVGVGDVVPVGSPAEPNTLTDALRKAAGSVGARTVIDTFQRSSDHWSFAREGLPGVRLGATPYAAYHSPADLPAVVRPAQLERVARIVVAWLR
jgi:aminopeptidase YwaD